jgi:molecular chaperone GrpE
MTTENGARPRDAANELNSETAASDPQAASDAADGRAVDPAEALAKEAAEMRDRWMRAMAEMENLRRRTEREVADARSYGIANFARDMLGVADNMRRALAALSPETHDSVDAGVKALVEGVELTERELAKSLEKHGVRRLEPQGQKFDPNFHQAMFEVPDPSVPTGTVVQVVQDGYTIGERVLRPALVGVAKGGAKAAATPPANDNPQESQD